MSRAATRLRAATIGRAARLHTAGFTGGSLTLVFDAPANIAPLRLRHTRTASTAWLTAFRAGVARHRGGNGGRLLGDEACRVGRIFI